MTTPKAKFTGLALIAALCAGFTLGLTAPAWAGLYEAENDLSFDIPLLGKGTQLANCRCIVAALIGCHGLIRASRSRGRQDQLSIWIRLRGAGQSTLCCFCIF